MNKYVHLRLTLKVIANRKGFITHNFGNELKSFQIGNSVITEPPFDPGGIKIEKEYLKDLKNVFLFNVAHKLKEGRKLLEYFTVPTSKQKIAIDHFNSYFGGNYSPKSVELNDIVDDFENSKFGVEETVDRMRNVFVSAIEKNYEYLEDISDMEVLNRQVDLLYGADLMASYILLFTPRLVRNVLYKYVWSTYAFLDSNKEYLCCNWVVNGGKHDENLHKKFSLDELSNEDLIDIIRLHKNCLSFVKARSRKVLKTLDRSSLISIFQTILMKSIWAHYIHEPSSISIDKRARGEEDEEEIEYDEDGEPLEDQGYLDSIYNWMYKYKNRPNNDIKGINYIDNTEFRQLKTTLSSLQSLLMTTKENLRKIKNNIRLYFKKNENKNGKENSGYVKEKEKELEEVEELKQSLEVLINYYCERLDEMKGLYGKIKTNDNVLFLNNLIDYDKFDILNLLVIYLSALPELKQITNKQVFLNYLALNKITLTKLVYVAMIRTSPKYARFINHYYSLVDSGEEIDEEKVLKEREEIINQNMEKGNLQEDVLIFEESELDSVIKTVNATKLIRRRKMKIDNKMRDIILLGTNRTDEVTRSILKHPPHFHILMKLLNKNSYTNDSINETITLLNDSNLEKSSGLELSLEKVRQNSGDYESLKNIIRNKRVENVLGFMQREELDQIYNEFLKYIYPFNTVSEDKSIKDLMNMVEKGPLGSELMGDENIEIVYNNDILDKMKEDIKSEDDVMGMMNRYLETFKNKVYDSLKYCIKRFMTYSFPDLDSSNEENVCQMDESKEIDEKEEEKLMAEFEEYVKKLEGDENTLKIEYNTELLSKRSTNPIMLRSNVFNIIKSPPNSDDNEVRKSKLYATEENITFINREELGEEDVERGFRRRKEEEPVEEVLRRVIFNKRFKRERIENLQFDENAINRWTKLGLSPKIANAALSYLSYNHNQKIEDENVGSVDDMNKLEGNVRGNEVMGLLELFWRQMNFKPSLIQAMSIPEVLKKSNKNLVISGGVGSGKTLAYLLPILQRLKEHELNKLREPSSPRCLIIAPTTELCSEISRVVKAFSHLVKITPLQVSKGVLSKSIKDKLKGLVDVVVATPSRLLKFRKHFKLNRLKYLVLEEADCLLNEGFFPLVYTILEQIPNYSILHSLTGNQEDKGVQIIQVASNINYIKFFETIHQSFRKFVNKSNNENDEAKGDLTKVNLVKLFGKHRKRMELYKHIINYYFKPLDKKGKSTNRTNVRNGIFEYNTKIIDDLVNSLKIVDEVGISRPIKGIKHVFLPSSTDKVRTLINTLKYDLKYPQGSSFREKEVSLDEVGKSKIVVFCKKVDAVRAIDHYLTESNFSPISVHSKMSFQMRERNFRKFRESKRAILVTTELMSRGLNLDVDTVILFDFPLNPNEYIRKSSVLIHSPFLKTFNSVKYTTSNGIGDNELFWDITNQGSGRIYNIGSNYTNLLFGEKTCIGLIDKKDKVLSEAIRRSLYVDYFPLTKLTARKTDYDQITGRLKYLTQSGGYFKFLNHLRELQVKGVFNTSDMYKYLDKYREIVKEQFLNSMKKVKLRRIRICKRRRELMRRLKMLKKWNKAIRLKQRIISDIDHKKRTKDYIYVNFTKDQRSCPPMKSLKKVRYELLKLKLLKGSNSEKLLKRSLNQILKFINNLQIKLINHKHLIKTIEGEEEELNVGTEEFETKVPEPSDNLERSFKLLDIIKSDNSNKKIKRICSLI